MATNAIIIYATCADTAEAEKIATDLVEKQLIACANILPPHTAIHRWEGKIEKGAEVAMILKTRAVLFEDVRAAILAHHSYECPCILSWPIEQGHPEFLGWIAEQTE